MQIFPVYWNMFYHLLGGTLLLTKKSDQSKYCALIRSSTQSTSAVARLVSTLGGAITFREFCNDSIGDTCTSIYSNLFFLDGTKTAGQFDWKIYNGQSEEDGAQPRCSKLTAVVKTFTAPMDVGVNSDDSKRLFTESIGMPVSGSGSIVDKSVAIMAADGSILTCATIVQIKPRSVEVTFNRDGVKGYITFDQNSPFDPTNVNKELTHLRSQAQSYHIHEYPVPQRWHTSDSICSAVAVGGHYNPYGVTNAVVPGTDDQFEIGYLSFKYGGLSGLDIIVQQSTDDNLPLFGTHSIVGRSVVIHYDDATGSRWICENINYGIETDTIIGNFKYPVIGSIMLRQLKNEPHSDTSLFIQLGYSDARPVSSGHAWHVHKDPTGDDFDSPLGQRCITERGTYNPYKVSTSGDSNYYSECKSGNTLRCKLGDLAGRHGNLTIGTDTGGYAKLFLTDIHMPLSGPMTILGRSIDVHAPNYDRLSCTTLRKVIPAVAKVRTWSPGGATGTITVKQETLYDQTHIELDLAGLQAAGGYHVHEYPILEGSNQPCADGSTGGHLNPFDVNATASPAPGQGTQDEYEVGDLSGKFGRFTGMTTAVGTYTDNNLPLRGLFSSIGRAMVIHKELENTRWVCGNIEEDTSVTGGRIHRAKVVFTTGVIRGEIEMVSLYSR